MALAVDQHAFMQPDDPTHRLPPPAAEPDVTASPCVTDALSRRGVPLDLPPAASSPGPGRFTRGAELGRGGMGQVVEWYDRDLRRMVAAKVVLPGAGAALVASFVAEAQVTAQLEHPNIVPVHDVGFTAAGAPFYTMKRIAGQPLSAVVAGLAARKPATLAEYPLSRRVDVFRAACQALAYAHSRGVVHLDLKPDNLMLGAFGEVLVVDWGLAAVTGAGATGGRHVEEARGGTPRYMSPEQVDGQPPSRASDVYALGGLLYTLLTGTPPFTDSGPTLLKRVLIDPPEPPRRRAPDLRVPRPLEAICLKALAKEPSDRYPDAAALLEDLDRYREDLAVSAHREPVHERVARWGRRHRALAVGMAAALAVAGLGAGFLALREVERRREEERQTREEVQAMVSDARRADRRQPHDRAVRQLSALASAYTIDLLLPLLDDPDEWVRLLVAEGAGWIAYQLRVVDPPLADRVARALLERRGDPNRSVQKAAITFVARLDSPAPEVAQALHDHVLAHAAHPAVRETREDWQPYLQRRLRLDGEPGVATPEAALERARAALLANRPGDALEALAPFPDAPALHLERANALHALAEPGRDLALVEQADVELARALEADPTSAPAHALRGGLRWRQGRFDEALAAYGRALELDSRDVRHRLARGELLLELNRAEEALADLRLAADAAPDDAAARSGMGRALLQLRRWDEGRSHLDAALALNADDLAALRARSWTHLFLGDEDAAVLDQERAIQLDPRSALAFSQRGGFFYSLFDRARRRDQATDARHRLDEAVASWQRALELQPDSGEVHGNLGRAHHDLAALTPDWRARAQSLREAGSHFREALRLGPPSGVAYSADAGFVSNSADSEATHQRWTQEMSGSLRAVLRQLAQLLARQGQLAEALTVLDALVALEEPRGGRGAADARKVRGLVRQQLDDLDGALEDLEAALRHDPDYPEAPGIRTMITDLRRRRGRE